METKIKSGAGFALISQLKALNGAINYDGDASNQVLFKLSNGKTLRFGVTDNDVGSGFLWVDQYEGLTKSEQKFFSSSDKKVSKLVNKKNGKVVEIGSYVNYGSDGIYYIYEIDPKTKNIGLEGWVSWDGIDAQDIGCVWK